MAAGMTRAFGVDIRQRVIDAIEGGMSTRAAARRYSIGESTAGAEHRRWRATGRIKVASARLLYLPPYSPDFNPIEMAFSKAKALRARTQPEASDNLWQVIAEALDTITPA